MTAHSAHRRFKGHCWLCAMQTQSYRGVGKVRKLPARDQRKLGTFRRTAPLI